MVEVTNKVTVNTEEGQGRTPCEMIIALDPADVCCPITFYVNNKPVFSMGNDEIEDFIETLNRFIL